MKRRNFMLNFSRRSFLTHSTMLFGGLLLAPDNAFSKLKKSNQHKNTLRLGIIGMGSRGKGIASVLKQLQEIEIVACCDIMESAVKEGVSKVGGRVRGYQDYKALLDDKQVEAVVIALPLYLHYSVAIAALNAGKHVYLEKTMTYNAVEAARLEKKVKQHPDLIFQVGFQYRYYGLYHKVADIIKQGWIGDVLQYECQYHRNSDWRKPVSDPTLEPQVNWRMYKAYSGGLMAELCAHQIDIVNWLTGTHPQRVTAVGGIDYWKDGRETFDNIRAIFEYPNGVKASVSSILSNAYRGYSIRVLGSRGTIEIQQSKAYTYPERTKKEMGTVDGVTGATLTSWGQGKREPIEFDSPDGKNLDPTAYAFIAFADSIRTKVQPFANIEVGKINAIAVHLANQAAETGQPKVWNDQ